MQRYAPTAIVLALLAVTALAFVTTQRQKLEPSPVGRIAVDPVLSPVCGCDKRTATIVIGLRRTDTVTLDLVSSDGTRVRTLVDGRRYRARSAVNVEWDGRDDDGRIVPDGSYRPRLTLESGARSFVLRNPIQLDTRAPEDHRDARLAEGLLTGRRRPERSGDRALQGRRARPRRSSRRRRARRLHAVPAARGLAHVEREAEGRRPLTAGRRVPTRRGGSRRGRERGQGAGQLRDHSLHRARPDHDPGDGPDPVRGPRQHRCESRSAGGSPAGRASASPGCSSCGRRTRAATLLFVEANGHGARARVVVRPRQTASRSPAASSQATATPASGQTR